VKHPSRNMNFATLKSLVQTLERLLIVYFIFFLTQTPASIWESEGPAVKDMAGMVKEEAAKGPGADAPGLMSVSQDLALGPHSRGPISPVSETPENFEDRIFRPELADSEENPFLWQYVLSFQPSEEEELNSALTIARSAYDELLLRHSEESVAIQSLGNKMKEVATRIRLLSLEKESPLSESIEARLSDFLEHSEQWSRKQVDVRLAELRLEGLRKSYERFRGLDETSSWLHSEVERESSRIVKDQHDLGGIRTSWESSLSRLNLEHDASPNEVRGLIAELNQLANQYRLSIEQDSANQLILDQFDRVFAAADQAGLSAF
jgi:hypothetical protein